MFKPKQMPQKEKEKKMQGFNAPSLKGDRAGSAGVQNELARGQQGMWSKKGASGKLSQGHR